ncbi:MAG: fasciclin domain-containing protein, partial [Pseudomonadota bacterium]
MTKTLKLSFAAILLGATALSACEAADEALPEGEEPAEVTDTVADSPPAEEIAEVVEPTGTIVAVAVATEDLSTLVAAVTAAELVDTLSSEGPFTVFAPPNSAFEKLPEGTVAS